MKITIAEDSCYVCHRTFKEIKEMHQNDVNTNLIYDKIIKQLEQKIQSFKDDLRRVIAETEGIHSDFKLGTILTDVASFEKTIPGLSKILPYAKVIKYPADSWTSIEYPFVERLSPQEVREGLIAILRAIESENDFAGDLNPPGYENIRDFGKLLHRLRQDKEKAANRNIQYLYPHRISGLIPQINFGESMKNAFETSASYGILANMLDDIGLEKVEKTEIKIVLCPICNGLFQEASRAAYSTMDYDDDE